MENYKDTLAKLANQMNTKIATETATPEQNELKKEFGRIFQLIVHFVLLRGTLRFQEILFVKNLLG